MARQAYAPTPLIRIVVQKENAGLFDARWFPARSLPAHFRCLPCGSLRRRTPGPPPFSSMNSTQPFPRRLAPSGRHVGDDQFDHVELLADLAFGYFYIVTVLEIHPELCGAAKDALFGFVLPK